MDDSENRSIYKEFLNVQVTLYAVNFPKHLKCHQHIKKKLKKSNFTNLCCERAHRYIFFANCLAPKIGNSLLLKSELGYPGWLEQMVGLKVLCSAVTRSALSDAPVTALAAPRSPGGGQLKGKVLLCP